MPVVTWAVLWREPISSHKQLSVMFERTSKVLVISGVISCDNSLI
jgi:hypothetical protein